MYQLISDSIRRGGEHDGSPLRGHYAGANKAPLIRLSDSIIGCDIPKLAGKLGGAAALNHRFPPL